MRGFFVIFLIHFFFASKAQEVITIAGLVEVAGAADGPALEATFNNPHGIAMDLDGNVYVADRFGHKIRKYSQDGQVVTIAGSGIPGDSDGSGLEATFNEPWGICVGVDGNLYVADTRNNLIRKISPEGMVSTFAGSGNFGGSDGQGINATFGNPTGIETDANGNLYIADHLTHVIRKISPAGFVTTVAGILGSPGSEDGNGSNARFYRPYGLTLDNDGNILVADEWNHLIRKVTPNGDVTTIAGTGSIGHVDGNPGESEFNYPWDITVDDLGNIYVADGYNHVIRKLMPTGSIPESYQITTYVGQSNATGSIDGFGTNASFNAATGIHFWNQTKEIFVADAYNNLIRKIIDIDRPTVSVQLVNIAINDPDNIEDQFFCFGTPMEFVASPDTLSNYTFYVNGQIVQNSSSPVYTADDIPVGHAGLMVTSTSVFGLIESNTINFTVSEQLIEDFTADPLLLDSENDVSNFEVLLNDYENISYYWNFGDPDSADENVSELEYPTHQYTAPGVYTVSLMVENHIGCRDTLIKENYIIYRQNIKDPQIFVPTAFTPNNDGENDVLYVRGEEITSVEFFIYNQWGELVFQTNDINQGWDGFFRGKPASSCTYTYLVRAELITGQQQVQSGHVSIIR